MEDYVDEVVQGAIVGDGTIVMEAQHGCTAAMMKMFAFQVSEHVRNKVALGLQPVFTVVKTG